MSLELLITINDDYPLSPLQVGCLSLRLTNVKTCLPHGTTTVLQVECGKRAGVSEGLWRKWMVQLLSFINSQNGSILDGLLIWKSNIDNHFKGAVVCSFILLSLSLLVCTFCFQRRIDK